MLPLEIELFAAAWDNVKKNVFNAGSDLEIDMETGEIVGEDLSPNLVCIVDGIDDRLRDLISHYQRDNLVSVYAEDDEDIREPAERE